jgi:4a-hydroxytetrahydrobiopterin dehydratase
MKSRFMRKRGSGCDILNMIAVQRWTPMKLSKEEIYERMKALSEWVVAGDKLHREYKFPSFALAIGFIAASAPGIEKMDHHPEWSNVYNRVTVDLTSHDEGGITERDVHLAHILEGIALKLL